MASEAATLARKKEKVRVEYHNGVYIIYCNGRPVARAYLDGALHERLGWDPYYLDEFLIVEPIEEGER